jgi:glycosyltransferase involved in cell wall biosynthesis
VASTSTNTNGGIVAIYWGISNPQTAAHAARLGAPLHYVHYLGWKRGPLIAAFKYLPQSAKTWSILRRERPAAVYVAISPVFAALSVYLYCLVSGAGFVMDVHNHALYSRQWRWSVPLVRLLARRSLMNIVDQPLNRELFDEWGVPVLILERPPLPPDRGLELLPGSDAFSVTVINTFADDEPIAPVFGAAELLPAVMFYVLGDTGLADRDVLAGAPPNVTFTGYLNGDDYWSRLYSSQAIVALTTADYSLLSAAIEAMTVERPPILSRRQALTDYFSKGAVFVDHTAESIAEGVMELMEDDGRLTREISELNLEKRQRWESEADELASVLQEASR